MKKGKKVVKGWAVMDGNRKVLTILLGAKLRNVFYLGSCGPYQTSDQPCRPVLITFPEKQIKRKK